LRSFPRGWYYQTQIQTCRAYTDELLPLLDPKTKTVSQVMVTNDAYNMNPDLTDRTYYLTMQEWGHPLWHPFSILERAVFRGGFPGQFAYAQGSADLARVACALERYRLRRGEYPKSLDELVPQFIDKLPHDVINGQPLHYRLTSDHQFVLYSVGWKDKDEGGKVPHSRHPLIDVRNGNWVWRYP
jgi:hypothetical protein